MLHSPICGNIAALLRFIFCKFSAAATAALVFFIMCIYRCEIKKFNRSSSQSAVSAAAYRSGEVLTDERDWQTKESKTHDYTLRGGVVATGIVLPEGAPSEFNTRATLWNAAERSEMKGNSLVAREAVLALPHELTDEERLNAVQAFAAYMVGRYGVACDYAVHRPDKRGDRRNHHAHVMFTTRSITKDGIGAKTRVLDDKKTGSPEFKAIRKQWEIIENAALEQAGVTDRVDCRSLKAQGIARVPEPKQGAIATQMEREGKDSHAGEERRAVKAYNETLEVITEDTDDDDPESAGRRMRHVDDAQAEITQARKENRGFTAWLYRRSLALLRLLAVQRKRRMQQQQNQLRQTWQQIRLRDLLMKTWAANDRYSRTYPQQAQAPPVVANGGSEVDILAMMQQQGLDYD